MAQRSDEALGKIDTLFKINCLANAAWISVATIANVSTVQNAMGWDIEHLHLFFNG